MAGTVDLLPLARDVLGAQPFSRLLGTRITACAGGMAVLELDIDDRHGQQYGLVHGGVLSYLADNVISFAAGSVLGPSLVSTGFTIELLDNVRDGSLRAVGRVVHSEPGFATVEVEVSAYGTSSVATVCARATGTAKATKAPHDQSQRRTRLQ